MTSVITVVEVQIFVCFCGKCSHVSAVADVRFVRLALKFVMHNDGDFVGVILLYLNRYCQCKTTKLTEM